MNVSVSVLEGRGRAHLLCAVLVGGSESSGGCHSSKH